MTYKNLLSTLKNFKARYQINKYFAHKHHRELVEAIKLIRRNSFYDENDLKAYVSTYLVNKNYYFYYYHKSWFNLIKVNLPIEYIPYKIKKTHALFLFFKLKIISMWNIVLCNAILLYAILKSISIKNRNYKYNQFIYFHNLKKNNIISSGIKSYLQSSLHNLCVDKNSAYRLYTNLKELSSDDIVVKKFNIFECKFNSINHLMYFAKSLLTFNTYALSDFMSLRGSVPGLYREVLKKILFSVVAKEFKDVKLIFDNSSMSYTPLWAIGKGIETYLVFYSTNFGHNFDSIDNFYYEPFEYRYMRWSYIFTWDQLQSDILTRNSNNKLRYKIINKINYVDSGKKFYFDDSKFNIVIFDVAPKRITNIAYGGSLGDIFYDKKYMFNFIRDIFNLNIKNSKIYLKKKRIISSEDKMYGAYINHSAKNKYVSLLDETISPERIILKASLVICPVYSTPSLIANQLNVPTFYYDPMYRVKDKLLYTRDINLIQGVEQLKNHVMECYDKWNES